MKIEDLARVVVIIPPAWVDGSKGGEHEELKIPITKVRNGTWAPDEISQIRSSNGQTYRPRLPHQGVPSDGRMHKSRHSIEDEGACRVHKAGTQPSSNCPDSKLKVLHGQVPPWRAGEASFPAKMHEEQSVRLGRCSRVDRSHWAMYRYFRGFAHPAKQ